MGRTWLFIGPVDSFDEVEGSHVTPMSSDALLSKDVLIPAFITSQAYLQVLINSLRIRLNIKLCAGRVKPNHKTRWPRSMMYSPAAKDVHVQSSTPNPCLTYTV